MAERRQLAARVVRTERLSASLVRVVLTGDDLVDFDPIHADSYVKMVFPPASVGDRPRLRAYTVRAFDPSAHELTLDFVVHGDTGLAGPWAVTAQPGDEVQLTGPGGGYTPREEADWHLLVGDESALPAIAAALGRMPADALVQVFVEVHGPEDQVVVELPSGAQLDWLHRGTGAVGSRLIDEVLDWSMPDGAGQFFVHGEAGWVKDLRRYLRVDRGIPMAQLSISGYWRVGVNDEGWRSVKKEWNRTVEDSERVLVGSVDSHAS